MKKILITFVAVMLINLLGKGQDLFLIGEKSYPCTIAIKLESNSYRSGLDVFLARNGTAALIGVSTGSGLHEVFRGKLIVYLKDGNVVTCSVSEASEKVNAFAKALYPLTDDQLALLKASDIHTVKYTLYNNDAENYSASNKGIETHKIISEFFAK